MSPSAVEISLLQAAEGATVEVAYEVVERCEHCQGNGAEPGTPIETCERCGGAGQLQAVTRTPFGQMVRTRHLRCLSRRRPRRHRALPRVPRARPGQGRAQHRGRHPRRDRRRPADPHLGVAGHAGEAGAPAGDLYVLVKVRADERFVREGDDLDHGSPRGRSAGRPGREPRGADARGERLRGGTAGTQSGEVITLRGKGMPTLRRGRHGDLRVVVDVVTPRRLNDEQRELLQRLNDSLSEENLRSEESLIAKLRRVLRSQAA